MAENRGRDAQSPRQIPKKGWKDILKRVFRGVSQQNATVLAAGTAFYAFTSVPAMLSALLSVYGLAADPAVVETQMRSLSGVIPAEAIPIIEDQLKNVSSRSGGSLTLTLILSLAFALYTASSAMKALISSLNVMYGETEKRGFLKYNGLAMLLTFGAILMASVAIALVVGVTAIIDRLAIPEFLRIGVSVIRWPALAVFVAASIALIYRYGPSREDARWRWLSWGGGLATGLWLVGSGLFSWYASAFGNYNKTYGSLAAIVILLFWFYLSALAVLLGAKLNAEMEHQTDRDTTTGPPQPMGKRGAQMADTRGEVA